jgi:hypothetical protein
MRTVKSKVLQLFLALVQLLFSISVYGAYTGWFKGGMDLLETMFFFGHLIFVFAIVVPSHIYLLLVGRNGGSTYLAPKLCVLATMLCLGITVAYNFHFFGRMYPPLEGNHIKDTVRTFVDLDGRSIDWWVEFVNPFHENHKERLILSDGQEKRIIEMTLVERRGKFVYNDDDNICLEQINSNLLLRSRLEIGHQIRFVLIDYESGSVISNWVEVVEKGDRYWGQSLKNDIVD